MGTFVRCLRVEDVEVLWAVKVQLTAVMENVTDLMIKVNKRLDLVMGLGSRPKRM